MNTAATATPFGRRRLPTRAKVGLGIAVFIGATSVPSAFSPTPDGEVGPPLSIMVLDTVLGVVAVAAAVWAWRTGNRNAIRITAAAVIMTAVSGLPGLFVDIPAGVKVAVAVGTLVSLASVVLMFSGAGRTSPSKADVAT